MLTLPRSVRLAAWGSAWLRGAGSLDDLPAAVARGDDPHLVVGLPAAQSGAPGVPLTGGLVALRAAGAVGLRAALPVPGDPLGLAGPPALTEAATAAGEAVVAVGALWALVPDVVTYGPATDVGRAVTWRAYPCTDRVADVPTVAEAEQGLALALREAAAQLTELDVGAAARSTLDEVARLRSAGGEALPPASGPRASALAERAVRLLALLDLAAQDAVAASSASRQRHRAAALAPLERAARRALVAAAGAALEPSR